MFTKGIRAKLNESESEGDTVSQNGLESAKFLIPVPHYNFCIVHCNTATLIPTNINKLEQLEDTKLAPLAWSWDQGDLVWSDLAQNFSDFVIGSDGTVS